MRTLYPELTDDEYTRTIKVMRDRTTVATTLGWLPAGPDAPGDFGSESEAFTFERICVAIAGHYWEQTWTSANEKRLRDPARFAGVQVQAIAVEVFNMAIRPLADSMRDFSARHTASYAAFCDHLLSTGFTKFATAYPVLWGRLETRITRKVQALVELLDRLEDDRVEIERTIGILSTAAITEVVGSGDTHGGGRTVSIVSFVTGQALIYKPRPVDCEAAWTQLADWVSRRYGLRIHGLTVIDKDGYGYVKFVAPCEVAGQDFAEVGHLAAVLYLLSARDMHFSNIQNTDDGPVAIDLETLLHPPRQKSTGLSETPFSAYRILGESVYGTGVLPLVVTKRGQQGAIDIGFAGGGKVYGRNPFRRFKLENEFRADLRVVWDRNGKELEQPPAISEDAARAVHKRCAEMVDGFTTAYRLVSSDVEAFSDSVRDHFTDRRVRYIHNPTVLYDQALRILTGTEANSDLALANGLLKRVAIASPSAARELVESECQQIWETDVPYFLMVTDRRSIYDAHGQLVVEDAFALSPMQEVERKLASLSEDDLELQVRLIRMAFNAKLPDPHIMKEVGGQFGTRISDAHGPSSDAGRLRQLAVDLADNLVSMMVEDRFAHLPHTWVGPVATAEANRPWSPGVLGYDLYTGRVGPALALSALGTTLGHTRYTDAAEAVFTPIAKILNGGTYEIRSITQAGVGAYNGFAGTVWALAGAGRLLDRPDYMDASLAATAFLTDEAGDSGWFDYISGGVGAEIIQLEVATLGGRPVDEALLQRIDRACRLAVENRLPDSMEYSGLAHGVAGLMLYSGRVFSRTGLASAQELYKVSRTRLESRFLVDDVRGFRTNASGQESYTDSWCNGTAGLMIAMTEGVGSGLSSRDDLSDLIARLRAGSISTNLTLCHGILGLQETTAWMARQLGSFPAVDDFNRDLLAHVDADVIADGVYDIGSRYSQSTSLMAGRAGVVLHLSNRMQANSFVSPLSLDMATP